MGADPDGQSTDAEERTRVRRLAEAWYRRASVRSSFDSLRWDETYDPSIPDYPVALLPFAEDPRFADADPSQQERVLTMSWIVYNERVIAAEEQVAIPTFAAIRHGSFTGTEGFQLQRALQQSYLDEVWHTYLHMMVMQRTREERRPDVPTFPSTVSLRRLLEASDVVDVEWKRQLLKLAWTTVAEVSVNAYLSLLSDDQTIQPLHSLVPRLHARDEAAHSSIMIDACKAIYLKMTSSEREFFVGALPQAVAAFSAQDFAVWRIILSHAGFADTTDIVEDCSRQASSQLLVRDFSGVERMVRELDINVAFDA